MALAELGARNELCVTLKMSAIQVNEGMHPTAKGRRRVMPESLGGERGGLKIEEGEQDEMRFPVACEHVASFISPFAH